MKLPWRTGAIEQAQARGDISWLEDHGFWTLAGDLFMDMEDSLQKRLNQEGNPRDKDMYLKGQIKGVWDMKYKLNELMMKLKSG